MAPIIAAIVALVTVVTGCASTDSGPGQGSVMIGPDVRLDSGPIRGQQDGDVLRYRGIPYAAAPTGPLRFAPPAPVQRWTEVRSATASGPPCPQQADLKSTQEDCLHVEVTTPVRPGGGKRPVLVWLHGGGFTTGAASEYDPRRLATIGDVVVVTVDFRLGTLSNMALPDMVDGGSFGQQDQRAALRWVRANAAAFGGDPRSVTLLGQSGGAVSACSQLVTPKAAELFDRVVLQSGSCGTYLAANFGGPNTPPTPFWRSTADSYAATTAAAGRLGCRTGSAPAVLACLRAVPVDKLNGEVNQFAAATYGTPALPTRPDTAVADGGARQVPVLAGFNRDEGLIAVATAALTGQPVTDANRGKFLRQSFGTQAGAVAAEYPPGPDRPADHRFGDPMTDLSFACPTLADATALARDRPVYLYEFADPAAKPLVPALPGADPGAAHGSELAYLFDRSNAPLDLTGRKIPLTDTQQQVATDMIHAWTTFARDGKPQVAGDWPQWTNNGQAHVFTGRPGSTDTAAVATSHHCRFWTEHPVTAGR